MVSDSNNRVYTELYEYLKTIGPIEAGQDITKKPAKFPYMYFFQIDSHTTGRTLSRTEDVIQVAYQIEIFSARNMDEARKISEIVRAWMIEQGFECITFRPMQGYSPNRFVSRYRRLETEKM